MADELVQLSTLVASLKSEERLEELKKRFFHETIRLKLEPHPPDHADARWRIERFRLNPDFIQRLIDGAVSTRGVTLAYLKPCNNNTSNSNTAGITGNSNSGVGIIVPNEMQMLCQKKTIYQMILSYPNKTKDVQAKSQNAYMGEMQFILRNVPIFSQNHLHRVQSDHVKAWIQDSILKEDPHLTQLENRVKALRRDLQSIVEKLKRLPNEMVTNERNVEMKGERAEKIRREKYNRLRDSKFRFKADLGLVHNQVQEMKIEKLSQIELTTKCTEKSGVDCYDWAVQLYGNHREFNEEILLNKASWNTSFMYAIPNDNTANIKSEKDTSTRTSGTDETEYLVDTASISVERVEHGFGIYHRPSNYEYDEDSKEVCPNNHVDAYHGTYADGRYQGFGMLYTTCYIYGGGFEKHNLHGKGILMYKDGDVIESDFGIPPAISNASNGDDTIQIETPARKDYCTSNRYAWGQPICSTNGNTKITFCDGFYEGDTKNGTLSGKGVYTTITGDRMEGEFVDGILIQGTIRKSNGDLLSGTFKDGLLHGKGSLSSSLKRSKYTGYFVDGEKHGMGKEIFYKRTKASSTRKEDIILATYSGCFCNNERSGLGTFEFQDTGFTFINAVKDDLLLDGPWLRGNPGAGGKVTNSNYCSSTPTTNRSSTRYKFLNRFKRVEDHKEAIAGSELQEITRVESRFRTMVESKKKNIFDFHRKKVIKTRTHSVASNATRLDPKSKETEGIRASSSVNSVRNNTTYHHHPTSSRIRVDSNAARTSKHKTVRSTSKHVETLWSEMESTFERFQSVMDPVQQEYNSLGDKWEGIHLDTLRERATADREK